MDKPHTHPGPHTLPGHNEPMIGKAVSHTIYDPESRRTLCGHCKREIATGQHRCVCGAEFVGRLVA